MMINLIWPNAYLHTYILIFLPIRFLNFNRNLITKLKKIVHLNTHTFKYKFKTMNLAQLCLKVMFFFF